MEFGQWEAWRHNVKHLVNLLRNQKINGNVMAPRWNQGRAYPHATTEKTLPHPEYIIGQLADFYEPNEARQWIFAPQKLLAGESPAKLIRAGRIDEVMRLVGQLRDAVHL